jgi:hypothetical protein
VVVQELPLVAGKLPKYVIGQPDDSLSLPNSGSSPSASTLSGPHGVYTDQTQIIVADTRNHRVLVYPRSVSSTPLAASLVLGQPSFAASAPNRGGAAAADTLSAPEAAIVDGTRLIVADTGNHRVLVWNAFPTQSGQPADVVLGQPAFTQTLPNGGTGVATAASLELPAAVHVAAGKLFIADSGNNRVLVFDGVPTTSGASASHVLGQPDFVSRTPAISINDVGLLAGPIAFASDGASLFVADRDQNRVVAYDLGAMATMGAPAAFLLNANSGLGSTGPSGLAVEQTPLFTSRLYVADATNARVLALKDISRLH